MSQSPKRFRSPAEWTYLWLPLLPILGLVAVIVYGVVQQRLVANEIRQLQAAARSEGVPLGNHELTRSFDQRTSREHTDQWRDVFLALSGLPGRFGILATETVEGFDDVVPPGQTWGAEPIVSRYIEDAQPIIDEIERIVEDPRPTWQPLLFNDYSTLLGELQQSRSVMQLLAREFRVAVHRNDSARALRAIGLMRGVARSFDWRIGLISELISGTYRAAVYEALRPTLEFDFWSTEELDQIAVWLQEDPSLDQRWKESLGTEMAMGMEALESPESMRNAIGGPLFPYGASSHAKLRFLESHWRQMNIDAVGSIAHVQQMERVGGFADDTNDNRASITAIPLANPELAVSLFASNFRASAAALARIDGERRWTLTAVGLRKFRLEQNRWPKTLSELGEMGFSSDVWHAVPGEPLGYRVEESGTALLWTLLMTEWSDRNPRVFNSPPTVDDLGLMSLDSAVLTMQP